MCYVYFLLSEKKSKWIYVGSTRDYTQRLDDHNKGRVTSTKPFKPYKIIYLEEFKTIDFAEIEKSILNVGREGLRKRKFFKIAGSSNG
ncbi:GIY-YIG nuclease family protein, partial [Candidatus Microgenomates bacterium]|nr:GIY-YIG nuclease family protein [Candidatus Microgenomates bacterium]